MRMDPNLSFFSDYATNSITDETTIFPNYNQYPDAENGFKLDSPPFDSNFMNVVPFDLPDSDSNDLALSFDSYIPKFSPDGESFEPSSSWSPEGDSSSPSNDSDSSDPVLKYITQMLLEENMENKPPMFYDPLALKATEKSLYDVLGEQDPNSLLKSSRLYVDYESPDSNHSGIGSEYAGNSSTSIITGTAIATDDFVDPRWVLDPAEYGLKSNLQPTVEFSVNPSNGLPNNGNDIVGTSASKMVQNMFTDSDSILQFNRGLEEASKFLPKPAQLVIDLESYSFSNGPKKETPILAVKEEKIERPISPEDGPRSRKNHNRDDSDSDSEQGRSSKQTAVYVDESDEISEVFDKVLLWPGLKGTTDMCCGSQVIQNNVSKANDQSNGSTGGKGRAKKSVKKKETVDLRSLLILCAQAVSGNDFRTANELLKQIRQHSSPKGDGSQRLAHCFANGLEARLVGSGAGMPNLYTSLASKRTTAADILNAYRTHLHCCPFKKLSIIFANKMILHAAEKSKTLHIIDFGVLYGFQWPILIQYLSMREGGPPKLRITGIELPQRGFRPTERIEETGRRLARYCERFHVPFEYNPIAAQNWESIPIEDLKIRTDEVLAVNCMGRFKNLLDETVEVDCPRNAVLELIRKIKPNIFVHTIINGSYNAPFFVTRFREALFHFSSMFDMFDSALPREDEGRMMLENEMYGREAINVVACEGVERVERPETYKQWQVRTTRAGFKQLPLDQGTMEKCGGKLKCYNKDFVLDVDNDWMLQGWKGRIIYASSCWVPA
ncbi:scarecrow-like protein 33 [Mercurialis annua]|uniref:scarecrow-like protein 33 n=1 Tax=Mercurialis annua TaxID=3986 RepID=UPI00215ED407|nr:scarecrow-like protein 33 [Mercurialis annua]